MDNRSTERIRYHYEIERELAGRLKRADRQQRLKLYHQVYDELYSRVPDIPHLSKDEKDNFRAADVASLVGFLRDFVAGKRSFLEIGPGDFKLSMALATIVSHVYAVDVTDEVAKQTTLPSNVTFMLADGLRIPVPPGSIDVAFSDQVMEHLHPDDALEQLKSIYDALAPGGLNICITPNRLYGPHDVSKYFDSVASGLHLKEYAVSDVVEAFRQAGFSRVETYTKTAQIARVRVPVSLVTTAERCLDALPDRLRRDLACSVGFKWLLRARVFGIK
jgi:SAM-dependent methyltransferase